MRSAGGGQRDAQALHQLGRHRAEPPRQQRGHKDHDPEGAGRQAGGLAARQHHEQHGQRRHPGGAAPAERHVRHRGMPGGNPRHARHAVDDQPGGQHLPQADEERAVHALHAGGLPGGAEDHQRGSVHHDGAVQPHAEQRGCLLTGGRHHRQVHQVCGLRGASGDGGGNVRHLQHHYLRLGRQDGGLGGQLHPEHVRQAGGPPGGEVPRCGGEHHEHPGEGHQQRRARLADGRAGRAVAERQLRQRHCGHERHNAHGAVHLHLHRRPVH
mmetsp:Transcript_18941/g.49552  ORF Transcript_18941/g.49552 Transcript_18941/m.49552 type:complete len:269 (-) Transcript_18941:1143-1949(-)